MDEYKLASMVAEKVVSDAKFWAAIIGFLGAIIGSLLTIIGNNGFFVAKNAVFAGEVWQGQSDITYRGTYGKSPTYAIDANY
jgi:hypothetical protein